MVFAHPVYPPLRVVPDRLRIFLRQRHQRIALAQEAAQATIDEAGLVPGVFAALGGFNGLVDQRMPGVRRFLLGPDQRKSHTEQGIGIGWRRARRELLTQGLGAAQLPQGVKSQRLHAGPERGVYVLQRRRHRAARADGHQ